MARLVDIGSPQRLPAVLTLRPGDLLRVAASGGQVTGEPGPVELLGAFRTAALGTDGQVVTPAGPPNAVLFLARHAGRTRIAVSTGDPFRGPGRAETEVVVEG